MFKLFQRVVHSDRDLTDNKRGHGSRAALPGHGEDALAKMEKGGASSASLAEKNDVMPSWPSRKDQATKEKGEITGKWDKGDGRLHPDYPLYCEGLAKPYFRGKLHLLACLLLPLAAYNYWLVVDGDMLSFYVGMLYLFTNLACYGASALYHCGQWDHRTEIFMQKLDHSCISVMSVGVFIPSIVFYFPPAEGYLFTALLLGTSGFSVYGVAVENKASILRQVLVPVCSLLFVHRYYSFMTSLEFTGYLTVIGFKALGTVVFAYEKPDPCPKIFGYHEMFHVLITCAGVVIYLCNWSLLRRYCDPGDPGVDLSSYDLDKNF